MKGEKMNTTVETAKQLKEREAEEACRRQAKEAADNECGARY